MSYDRIPITAATRLSPCRVQISGQWGAFPTQNKETQENMKMEMVAAVPAGQHTGIITQCHETTKTFDPSKGPEGVVELVIQPKWAKPGHRTLPCSVTFSPTLSSLSALGRLLARLNVTVPDGAEFVPASIEGLEVAFTTSVKNDGFVVVAKDTIRAA